jgi:hypothetical protein
VPVKVGLFIGAFCPRTVDKDVSVLIALLVSVDNPVDKDVSTLVDLLVS